MSSRSNLPQIQNAIRIAREARGLTLREVERVTGVGYSHLCRFEKGERSLTLSAMDSLAEAVGLDPMRLRAIVISDGLTAEQTSRLAAILTEVAQ